MKSSSSQKFIAGNIQHHLPQWLLLSQDSWIRQAVTGYSIDFDSEPPIQSTGPTYHRTKEEEEALDREIAELITKEAVEEVDFCQARFVSPMFIVPKKGGKWRPVLNLKSLNQYVSKAHFKLEDIRSLKDILHQGDFMAKLDLKEAYLSVPMAYQSRRFLQFPLEGQASPIHLPSLRTQQRPVCFHEAASPSSSLSERTGNPLPHVHR